MSRDALRFALLAPLGIGAGVLLWVLVRPHRVEQPPQPAVKAPIAEPTRPAPAAPPAPPAAAEAVDPPEPTLELVPIAVPVRPRALAVAKSPPPQLEILAPLDRSYSLVSPIPIRVRFAPRARILVNMRPLIERAPGEFAGQLGLRRGPNRLILTALDPLGRRSRAEVQVTLIDLPKVESQKRRLTALLAQLNQMRATTLDVEHQVEGLIEKIGSAADATLAADLNQELAQIQQSRRGLEGEIEQTIGEIDAVVTNARPGK
jgi:hypothetical protein